MSTVVTIVGCWISSVGALWFFHELVMPSGEPK